MSSNLMNFDRQQDHAFESSLVQGIQALDSYEAAQQVPQHLQQHNLLRHNQQQAHQQQQQQQQQQVQQQQQQQAQVHQHHQNHQSVPRMDHANGQANQRLLQQVPIDPSINDSASEKASAAQVAAAATAAANDLINVRNTKSAVNASNRLGNANSHQSQGPKITKPRVNKPGQKFGAKKKSWVWNWFLQDPVDSNIATCDFCGKIIRRLASDKGSPKKLGEHLKTHKIDKGAINDKRDSVMVGDANRHYFNTLNSSNAFKPHPLSNEASAHDSSDPESRTNNSLQSNTYNRHTNQSSANPSSEFTTASFDKSEFEQSPYSQPKFQKDIMRFLVENKLPLTTVKSASFRQVIYTLKPEAIPDLNELNHLYSSLLEVIHNEKGPLSSVEVGAEQQGDVGDRSVSRHDENVDDSLSNSTSWV